MNLAKIMIPKVSTAFLHEKDTVRQGLEIMSRYGYTAIPVLDSQERYLGCVTEGDFLRHILATGTTELKQQEKHNIRTIMRKDFCPALSIDASYEDVLEAGLQQNFVPVVDDRGVMCGIVTRRSIMLSMAECCLHLTPV